MLLNEVTTTLRGNLENLMHASVSVGFGSDCKTSAIGPEIGNSVEPHPPVRHHTLTYCCVQTV